MADRTYSFTIAKTYTVSIKAPKSLAERMASKLASLVGIAKYHKELTGVIGKDEREHVVMVLFSEAPLTNPAGHKADCEAFFSTLPNPITPENWNQVMAQYSPIWDKHLPIVDNRETPAQVSERVAIVAQHQAERTAKRNAWIDENCASHTPIPIPDGFMAITLRRYFNDSDSMTDYYCPHSSIGEAMLLALVKRGNETEAAARKVLARYPELAALQWTWNTEKYSGGHGNYLQSEGVGVVQQEAYNGRDEVGTWWEIEFTYGGSVLPYKNYTTSDPTPAESTTPQNTTSTNGNITIRRNEEKDGIEVIFPAKPSEQTLSNLKSNGFRWSFAQKLWYARYSTDKMAFAQSLA